MAPGALKDTSETTARLPPSQEMTGSGMRAGAGSIPIETIDVEVVVSSHRADTVSLANSAYTFLARIASGGMASVHVGTRKDSPDRALVAIKRTHPHLLEDPGFAQALAAEASVLARMDHPNVVGLRALEHIDGELLLVMDYVDGVSLSTLLSRASTANLRIPIPVVVRIILDTCAGLGEAHGLTDENGRAVGVVHRDVSPQNILVGVDGRAKIADFGIAKQLWSDATRTNTGVLKGKVRYMSPEYIEFGKQDVRGDVFALGLVLWEALTMKRPFDGSNEMFILRQIVAGPPPKPSSVVPGLDPAFDGVVGDAVEHNVDKRFPTARACGEAIETVARAHSLLATHEEVAVWVRRLAGESIDARRRAVAEAMRRLDGDGAMDDEPPDAPVAGDFVVPVPALHRRRRWLSLAAATLILAIVGVVASTYHRQARSSRADDVEASEASTISAGEVADVPPAQPSSEASSTPSSEPSSGTETAGPVTSRGAGSNARPSRPMPPRTRPAAASAPLRAPPNPYAKARALREQ